MASAEDIVKGVEATMAFLFDEKAELTPHQKKMIEIQKEETTLKSRNRELKASLDGIRNLAPRHVEANARRSAKRASIRSEMEQNRIRLEEIGREREDLMRG